MQPQQPAVGRNTYKDAPHTDPVAAHSPLVRFLEGPSLHAAVLLCIFLDIATTLCELMLSDVCPVPPHSSSGARTLHAWSHGLSWTGRGMLGVLLLHQTLLLFAMGRRAFFSATWEGRLRAIDFFICTVAVGLEVAEARLGGGSRAGLEDNFDEMVLMALLAFRVTRVVHGFVVAAEQHVETSHQIVRLQSEAEGLRAELAAAREEVARAFSLAGAAGKGGEGPRAAEPRRRGAPKAKKLLL